MAAVASLSTPIGTPSPTSPTQSLDSSWQGWAELENDPIIFSTLLHEWGVQGVTVHEVIPLDAIFDASASSTFGLIFLSRYVAPNEVGDDFEEPPPSNLWFANQTSSFSCATVALMNIINNRTEIDLGVKLREFKAATEILSSKDKGLALDAFEHVRQVHNSFASPFEKMNVDLRLKEAAAAAARKKSAKSKKSRKRKKFSVDEDGEEEDDGFHFIAYVPAGGRVWRMDGLETSPRSMGTVEDGEGWQAMIVTDIQGQLDSAAGLEKMQFSLLRLLADDGSGSRQSDEAKMKRAREDWGPFISHLLRLHAENGGLREMLGM